MSLGALVLLSPLLAIAAAVVRISMGRPVLFRQLRAGLGGVPFQLVKLRTMTDRTAGDGALLPDVERLTSTGRVLRTTSIDELPQLWNVLRGDMSIVGPRPIRPPFFELLCEQIPQYWQRLVVRPGVTGFAQTRITREALWEFKVAHDLEYIADRSITLYFRVLGATVWRVVRRTLIGARRRLERSRRSNS